VVNIQALTRDLLPSARERAAATTANNGPAPLARGSSRAVHTFWMNWGDP